MTQQRSGHAYRQGLIAGVVLLCLGPAGARAQSAAGRTVTVTASFDVANAYLLRGINQDDTGVIMWPAADLGVVVKAGGQGGTGRMTVNLGTWNSLHTGAAGLDGLGKLWYQSDFYATFGVGVGGGLKVGAGYVARTSPNNAFPTMMELAFTVGAPAHWVAPYALVVGGTARAAGWRPQQGPISRDWRAAHVRAGRHGGGAGQGRLQPGGLLRRTTRG